MSLLNAFARRKFRRVLTGIIILGVLVLSVVRYAQPTVYIGRHWANAERVGCDKISHQSWDELLHTYVDSDGHVDYAAWKTSSSDVRKLEEYLNQLSRFDEKHPASRSQQIEFWVNAYNALTVRGILREYPTSSIQNHVDRLWGYNIWRDLQLIVGDKSYSLGEIEHSILRPLKEPRVHFAMVCGSTGCPRLLNEAYSAERLEDQLNGNTRAFFADPTKCDFDSERQELRLSPILKWYATDFGSSESQVLPAIADWLPAEISPAVKAGRVKVLFGDYDWSLNEQSGVNPPLPAPE